MFDNAHTAAVIAAVHPVHYVIPQSFDVSVLCAKAVCRAGTLLRTCVISHAICVTHSFGSAVITTTIPNFRLKVIVSKFDEHEHPNDEAHRIIHLPDGTALCVDRAAR